MGKNKIFHKERIVNHNVIREELIKQGFVAGNILSVTLIKHGVINLNYKIQTSNEKLLLRIYDNPYRDNLAIKDEIDFVSYLTKEKFPCAEIISNIFFIDTKPSLLFKFINGNFPIICRESIKELALLTAYFHKLTINYTSKLNRQEMHQYPRSHKTVNYYLEKIDFDKTFSGVKIVPNMLETLKSKMLYYFQAKFDIQLPKFVIHNDIQHTNIIKTNLALYLIDFDDIEEDYLIQDLARIIYHFHMKLDKFNVEPVIDLVSYYEKQKELTIKEKKYLPDLIGFNLCYKLIRYISSIYPITEITNNEINRTLQLIFSYFSKEKELKQKLRA